MAEWENMALDHETKTRRKYILHTIKKAVCITLSVYYCFNNFWRRKIISCVIRSPADYMAEWENAPLDPKKNKKIF